ncbi:alpha/beta hydrolase [Microbaculum marinisediminis]|uniref:Alpha/beta hydrolase n=1 Tax=Microbaculum marinisediminis TaxID=2931392 RepID=A0AAW5R4W2_9HYPH|nr:alpha/beta hydrolase [Microbaculum sp. A6E488]MCT8974437.1 alpha/beta hydrolase [Microbaculum sp. A6E488]
MCDPIVFVPGLLCTKALFGPQLAAFEGRVQCTVADHTRHDGMKAIVDSILDVAPERFVLVGLSMGGYIALEMAEHAPERMTKLVLMDTTARPDRPEQTAFREALMAQARADGLGPVIDQLLPLFVDDSRLGDAALVATIRQMADDTGVDAFVRQQTAIIGRKDARPDLGDVRCPTLVVCGDRDRLTPLELSEEIAAGIPGARLEMIEGSGHLTTLEKPEAVNTVLEEFLGL